MFTFLFLASSKMWGKLLVDYFGTTVDVGRKTELVICGLNSLYSADLGRLQALPHVSSRTCDVTDVRDSLTSMLLCIEMSHWCSSELVVIQLEVLQGRADPQDEGKSYSLWLGFGFRWIGHAVRYLLEMGLAAL